MEAKTTIALEDLEVRRQRVATLTAILRPVAYAVEPLTDTGKPRCCARVDHHADASKHHQCTKEARHPHDGHPFCATHNPEKIVARELSKARRLAERVAAWEAAQKAD